MHHALLLNVGILIAIILCLVMLNNPLALFGLLLLKDLPYGLMVGQKEDEEDEPSRPIGFIE